jgi:predicted membrane protein
MCNGRGFNLGRIIFGLIVLALGVIFTLDSLEVIESGNVLRFWPVILIAVGLGKILQPRAAGGKFFGLILAIVGTLLLLRTFEVIPWSVWDFWPLILVLLGLSILTEGFGRRRHRERFHRVTVRASGDGERTIDEESILKVSNVMSGSERVVTSQDFQGGRISTTLGGVEVDLRQATMKGDEAVISVNILLGGVGIRVPETWRVVLHANAALGGITDTSRKPADEGAKRLIVRGSVTLGGLEIRN